MKKDSYFKKMDNIRKEAVNKVADVISAPARIKSAIGQRRADSEFNVLKGANDRKTEPDFNLDGSVSDGFKYKSVAEGVKSKMMKRESKRIDNMAKTNLKSLPKEAKKTVKKGLKEGNVRFEVNSDGGEYIYSKEKFGKNK